MNARKISYITKNLLKGLIGFIIVLIIWSFLSYARIVSKIFLPAPIQVFFALINLFTEKMLLKDILISFYRILVGFFLAALISIPIGIFIGSVKSFREFFEPIIAFVRYIPPSAFVPLSILWLGIGDSEKFFIIFISTAPYLAMLIADIVSNIKKDYLDVAYTLGAKKFKIYTKVIVPYSLPGIFDSLRLMLGAAWTFIILVEIIAASSGIGSALIKSQRFLQTPEVIAIVILIGIIGITTDYSFRWMYKKLFSWTERGGSNA